MSPICPACCCDQATLIEIIDIRKQHQRYLPENQDATNRLTKSLSKITSSYRFIKCSKCNLEYGCPLVSPGHDWYSILYSQLQLYPSDRWEFEVVKSRIKNDDSVLDFGCGNGQFLSFISDKTQNIIGYDFSRQAVKQVLDQGIEANLIDNKLDFSLSDKIGNFNHITAFHVIEHLESAYSLFEAFKKISSNQTLLWVSVPSDKRAVRLYDCHDYLDQPPHHLTRWNQKALAIIGKRAGWELIDFFYEPIDLKTRLWEVSRRTAIYKRFGQKHPLAERIIRLLLLIPVYFLKRKQIKELSGFTMLACFQLERK